MNVKANNHIHTLHEGQQNSYHYSMFNIKVIIGILEVSLFLLCWEMFLYGGVCPLLMFYEARKADTVLLQMRVLMTNMGLIIPVNLQKLNFFFFWWPCIFSYQSINLRRQYCSSGYTHGAIIIKRNVSLEGAKSICARPWGADDSRKPAVKLKLKTSRELLFACLIVIRKKCSVEVNKTLLVCSMRCKCLISMRNIN